MKENPPPLLAYRSAEDDRSAGHPHPLLFVGIALDLVGSSLSLCASPWIVHASSLRSAAFVGSILNLVGTIAFMTISESAQRSLLMRMTFVMNWIAVMVYSVSFSGA